MDFVRKIIWVDKDTTMKIKSKSILYILNKRTIAYMQLSNFSSVFTIFLTSLKLHI